MPKAMHMHMRCRGARAFVLQATQSAVVPPRALPARCAVMPYMNMNMTRIITLTLTGGRSVEYHHDEPHEQHDEQADDAVLPSVRVVSEHLQ